MRAKGQFGNGPPFDGDFFSAITVALDIFLMDSKNTFGADQFWF